MADVLKGYRADADHLIRSWAGIAPEDGLAPVLDLLSTRGRALDIGAGTGRDAGFLAQRGLQVVAVEPVAAFRAVGQAQAGVAWCDAQLPDLRGLPAGRFDLILSNGVWHHLSPTDQLLALKTCAGRLAAGGLLVLSLRQGPGAPNRPVHVCDAEAIEAQARNLGMTIVRQMQRSAVQSGNRAAGVSWTWVVLRKT